MLDHAEHLVEGRSEQDVLYELLLKRGVDLTVPIEEKEIAGKTVYSIGYGVLFACLDETIDKAEIEALAKGITDWHNELEPAADTQVVFRDSAFADDIAKTNMTAILEQNGIAHVRSL
ncbi:adenine-specific DNA-methyltransferase [Pseudooceanicola nitratireducens]|nr:adenine-specific DNA-methyltransferase [Pseudooceanicola nitratireducens]